ncbi:MAG: TcpQ domain-containing protein [Alphaproteobacteria bacterium]|nr:TcpQ domain-containing protein [Alphaproteobacteria bacterium]
MTQVRKPLPFAPAAALLAVLACAAPVAAAEAPQPAVVAPISPAAVPRVAAPGMPGPASRAPGTIRLKLGADGYEAEAPPRPGVARQDPTPASPPPLPGVGGMPATVVAPTLAAMPGEIASQEVQLTLAAVPFSEAVRRAAAAGGVGARIEERPARMVGGAVTHARAPDITLRHSGALGRLLDHLARRAGYVWEWDAERREAVFARYWDRDQPAPMAERAGREPGLWMVDPDRHATLRDVLEDWAFQAGWQVDWDTPRNFSVSAHARYTGAFLRAVDHLLSAAELRRVLRATVHHSNRWVRVREAGS